MKAPLNETEKLLFSMWHFSKAISALDCRSDGQSTFLTHLSYALMYAPDISCQSVTFGSGSYIETIREGAMPFLDVGHLYWGDSRQDKGSEVIWGSKIKALKGVLVDLASTFDHLPLQGSQPRRPTLDESFNLAQDVLGKLVDGTDDPSKDLGTYETYINIARKLNGFRS